MSNKMLKRTKGLVIQAMDSFAKADEFACKCSNLHELHRLLDLMDSCERVIDMALDRYPKLRIGNKLVADRLADNQAKYMKTFLKLAESSYR